MRPLPPKNTKSVERPAESACSVASADLEVEQVSSRPQDDPSVQQWMRDKHISEDVNPTSWKLYLLGTISLALAIVTAFGARSVVAEALLRTADSFLPFHVNRRSPAAASTVHAQARKTALSGDLDRAVSMYKKAVLECDEKNPARPELLNDLGVALTASGNNVEAARYLKEAIQLNPSLIAAYNNLAVSQMLSGDKASAVSTLEEAVRIQPQNEYAALKLKRMWACSEPQPER
ncbi:MAG: tetratricopeptide repeat protein [Candidatus Melainabacteria bacterium]|nr:tetratricopeptide repeat protein [Candidatus Melainabacteria bacterium]